MDILNWIYLKTQGLIRTKANNPATDVIALGAEVPFTTRGDGYQTYGMPLADAVHAGCTENNTLRTGILDNYPFAIGYPVLLKTCTQVIDTPAFPTFLPIDLQGWKVAGSVNIGEQLNADSIYLGTVENITSNFTGFPWKITGTVYTFDEDNNIPIYTTLANGATVFDENGFTIIPCDFRFVIDGFNSGFDLYLEYNSRTLGAEVQAIVSFEFEFLTGSTDEPTFTYFP